MKKYFIALKIFDDIASSEIEPYARESLKKAASFSAERKAAGYENLLTRFIKKYPIEAETSYFYWILGRNSIKGNNTESAIKYFEEALKNIPDGNYSDRQRFWLQKIYQDRNNKQSADKYLKELLAFNPDSSFAWILIRKTLPAFNSDKLKSDFEKAVSSGNLTDALASNLLLYAKEMNSENKNIRIKKFNHSQIKKYNNFSKSLSSLDLESKYSKNLKNLERYFVIGYEDAISREVKLLPDEETAIKDKSKTLLHYAAKYGQFYYGVLYGIELLKLNGIKENISLLSDDANKVLYPQSHEKCANEYSAKYNVSTPMVYSLIRAESLFNHDAVSPVGALGLMQLMPDTAKGIARELQLKRYDLKAPCTSMLFGAKYISWLDKYYKGVYAYMVGAYNAGPGNVNKWKEKPELSDMDYFAEFIPFIETRYYIVRTDKFLTQYKIIYPSSK
jgi:tetratricopeptide (TPR) repeat protein